MLQNTRVLAAPVLAEVLERQLPQRREEDAIRSVVETRNSLSFGYGLNQLKDKPRMNANKREWNKFKNKRKFSK
jgi:hypothetical protein